ncbi:MAG: hypothetical protein B6242_16240 [Anaerolineaceae bacterium 4572_78]|nr:MAG: hypothetical protein B6242_16240 [Anaerolineaceae bacterium 4572_78]
MTRLVFSYIEQKHPVFGTVNRPLIKIAFYYERFGKWLSIGKLLVDTGADISVIPLPFGQILITDIELGQPIQLGGVLSSNLMANAFVHRVKARIGDHIFEVPVAVSMSSKIPPIFGRQEALDQFMVSFVHGKELILEI